MMKTENRVLRSWLVLAAVSLLLFPTCATARPAAENAAKPANTKAGQTAPAAPQAPEATPSVSDRASAYYHLGLAAIYEDEAASTGRPEDIDFAIEEYKKALNDDPGSATLSNELAELYFRAGRTSEAEATARALLNDHPDNVTAHKLLGRIYLRQLGEGMNGVSSSSPSGNVLDRAIAEFEKIVSLTPKSVEDHMILGQLYTVKHDSVKAEEQFKVAQSIEPDSEEVVLNLARLYSESSNLQRAAQVIEAVPANDRTAHMEAVLGATYDQMKQPAEAIAAYRRALELEPGDLGTMNALAEALLNSNQLDHALDEYRQIAQADPENAGALVHICEIQRRQGKYELALATARKAVAKDPSSLEAGYNEGLLFDVLGRYDDAVATYQHMVDLTSHANGAYTAEEKNNRSIFLERLGSVDHELDRVPDAIAAYQKLIDMGGEYALRGYQGQIDTYRDAKEFDKAFAVAQNAVNADPGNSDLKLILAGELLDVGKDEQAFSMAKSLLQNSDKDRSIWLTLAQMYIRVRRWKDADDAINHAAPMSTKKDDRVALLFVRGELAERQKHTEPAEKFFRQILELDPDNALTLNYLGYMLTDKGQRLPEALAMIRKAVDQDPLNGAYLDSLGWAYFKMGQYELAEENLRRAVERDRTDPTVHEHLGDLYEKTGRIRLAAAQWQLSLDEFAKSSPLDIEPGDAAKVQKKLDSARVKLAKEDSALGAAKP